MLYLGLFVVFVGLAILCGAVCVHFLNSTAFQGVVLYQEKAVLAWCWCGEMRGRVWHGNSKMVLP